MENIENFSQQLKYLDELKLYIQKEAKEQLKQYRPDPYESDKTDQINAALAKAQGDYPTINTNRNNRFLFNQYTDLDGILRAVRPALSVNGLSITQQTKIDDDKTILVTTLRHESDQFIQTRSRIIPSKNDVQAYASNLKAMKRHDIMSLLNITIMEDIDDDDGELDMETVRQERIKGVAPHANYSARKQSFEPITEQQLKDLIEDIKGYEDIAEDLMKRFNIQTLADLPQSKYNSVMRQVRQFVGIREGK